jgi:hypothetical protein
VRLKRHQQLSVGILIRRGRAVIADGLHTGGRERAGGRGDPLRVRVLVRPILGGGQLQGHGHRAGRYRSVREPGAVHAGHCGQEGRPGGHAGSAKNITVFAPDNAAFAKIPAATLKKVLANKAELTKILTYHVVGSPITPSQFASAATPTTLEGATATLAKMGSTYEVNAAHVVCGDVQTANATVYIIDTVLMPKS